MAAPCDSSTSVKRALLVGCNYRGTSHELYGCLNDTIIWQRLLLDCFEFPEENITILTDDKGSSPRATSGEIKSKLRSLVQSSKPGDILFFFFSGHGSQVADQPGGDEADGLDEVLVVADMEFLVDDELRDIFTQLKSGVKFTMVSDSCRSGSILDKTETIVDGSDEVVDHAAAAKIRTEVSRCPNSIRFIEGGSLEDGSSEAKLRGLPPYVLYPWLKTSGTNVEFAPDRRCFPTSTAGGIKAQSDLNRGMVITGCRASENSAETYNPSKREFFGCLSFVATEQLRKCKEEENRIMTNRELVLRVNYIAHQQYYPQHVRLEGLLDEADSKFILW